MEKMDWEKMEELFTSGDFDDLDNSVLLNHHELTDRLRKTLYYSPQKNPDKDTLSFSITKAAVETFRKAAPSSFGKLGHRYASRVARDACISPCSMLLAVIYLKRLSHRNPDYLMNTSSSDLFLISMMVASKYLYDEGVSDEVFNDEWAASGLVDTDHVNELEAEFLSAIDWRLFIHKDEFHGGLQLTEARIAFINGLDRGWFSYTDITCIMRSKQVGENVRKIIALFAKVICVSAALYGAVVLSVIGSMFVVKALNQPIKRDIVIQSTNFSSDNMNVVDESTTMPGDEGRNPLLMNDTAVMSSNLEGETPFVIHDYVDVNDENSSRTSETSSLHSEYIANHQMFTFLETSIIPSSTYTSLDVISRCRNCGKYQRESKSSPPSKPHHGDMHTDDDVINKDDMRSDLQWNSRYYDLIERLFDAKHLHCTHSINVH